MGFKFLVIVTATLLTRSQPATAVVIVLSPRKINETWEKALFIMTLLTTA